MGMWCGRVLRQNLTYFRTRRELFGELVDIMDPLPGSRRVSVPSEVFIVLRQFLTTRNESLDDNKRLSFDKAIIEIRANCILALSSPQPSAGVTSTADSAAPSAAGSVPDP